MTLALVIEDHPQLRILIKAMLGSMGIASITGSDGTEALELLRGSSVVDLVISDIEMPGMDGIELFKTAQRDGQLADIPWMLVSSADRRLDALEAGCACFLVKPFTLDEFRLAILNAQERVIIRPQASRS